jgi:hypothetical protein
MPSSPLLGQLVALLIDERPEAVKVEVFATAVLRSAGRVVGVLEAAGTEPGAIRVTVGERSLTIPVLLDSIEAAERDPNGTAGTEIVIALADAWTAGWAWSDHPDARRIWFDPFGVNDDPQLVSPTIR